MHALTRRCCGHLGSHPSLVRTFVSQQRHKSKASSAQPHERGHPWLERQNTRAPRAAVPAGTRPDGSLKFRRPHGRNTNPSTYDPAVAVVIGGGPAGIAAVANLLECVPKGKIVWVDREFQGGSIGQYYREVPSYHAVADYLSYARSTRAFLRAHQLAPPLGSAISALENLNLDMTCSLSLVGDMLNFLSEDLSKNPRVTRVRGTVTAVTRDRDDSQPSNTTTTTTTTDNPNDKPNHHENSKNKHTNNFYDLNTAHHSQLANPKTWTVLVNPTQLGQDQALFTYTTTMVIYCTGSVPRTAALPLPISRLGVETALSPSRLARLLPRDEKRTVAVIGDGHTAVLALRNLFRLAASSHQGLRVRWLTRRSRLRYAEEVEAGVVREENTGLMGEAARFARGFLEGERLRDSGAGGFITRVVLPGVEGKEEGGKAVGGRRQKISLRTATREERERVEQETAAREREVLREQLQDVDYVVQAIGFERGRLPTVRPNLPLALAPPGKPKRLVFNAYTGHFFPNGGSRDDVVGLFGAGSAFPESEITSEGWRAPAVGVWKFGSFLKRMVPRWVEATRTGKFPKSTDAVGEPWRDGAAG